MKEKKLFTRAAPKSPLILELCGGKQPLIERVHHGLVEVPLGKLYSHLNLDEVIAFAAGSFSLREEESISFRRFVESADIYDIFSKVFKKGFPWMNQYKQVSPKNQKKLEGLNPYEERLQERLGRVDPIAIGKLMGNLQSPINEYVFECQYQDRVRERGRNNAGLNVMRFQNVYPKSGRIVPAYALEIASIISKYPREYFPLPDNSPDRIVSLPGEAPKVEASGQKRLF